MNKKTNKFIPELLFPELITEGNEKIRNWGVLVINSQNTIC